MFLTSLNYVSVIGMRAIHRQYRRKFPCRLEYICELVIWYV